MKYKILTKGYNIWIQWIPEILCMTAKVSTIDKAAAVSRYYNRKFYRNSLNPIRKCGTLRLHLHIQNAKMIRNNCHARIPTHEPVQGPHVKAKVWSKFSPMNSHVWTSVNLKSRFFDDYCAIELRSPVYCYSMTVTLYTAKYLEHAFSNVEICTIYLSRSLGDRWGTTRPGNQLSPFLSFLCSPHRVAQFQTCPIPDVIF